MPRRTGAGWLTMKALDQRFLQSRHFAFGVFQALCASCPLNRNRAVNVEFVASSVETHFRDFFLLCSKTSFVSGGELGHRLALLGAVRFVASILTQRSAACKCFSRLGEQ